MTRRSPNDCAAAPHVLWMVLPLLIGTWRITRREVTA